MELINLTSPFHCAHIFLERIPLKSDRTAYTGMVYHFRHGSMETSYLDLPGHIAETDDGCDAQNVNLLDYYRRKTQLLRIKTPANQEYGITPADLEKALNGREWQPWIVINALGSAADGYQPSRRIYLTLEAVDYLARNGVKVLFSDAWESPRLDGVFLRLFDAGISAVCNLVNLDKLPADREFYLTMSFLPYPGKVTQIPASLIAEI
ncbi:MAG: hypothetical protein E7048_12140 [Lentisphaerae bacterium]|nr:hypothetical protein [Lentisphaerota bacterium]